MSCVGDNTDVTVQLPDEVLCHIFSFLSLSQKLQSESVNHKFQRCIRVELKMNPQPLEVDFWKRSLNGHDKMFRYRWNTTGPILGALETLAKKGKFSSIWLRVAEVSELDRVLSVLMSERRENQCLTKVTSLRSDLGLPQAVLENFLDKCGKLSCVRLDCERDDIRPFNTESHSAYSTFPDLHKLLKNRGLTELALKPFDYHQKDLTDVLQGIQPNTLRKLDLCFSLHLLELSIVELVNALGPNGSALEEIRFEIPFAIALRVQLADLFESLSRMPALRKCDIECIEIRPRDQFVAAVASLLAMSDINITVTADGSTFFSNVPGCQAVNMIWQVQDVHAGLVVDFDDGDSLVLSLGNASMVLIDCLGRDLCYHCDADDCVQCESFYPTLITLLHSTADDVSRHFVDAQHFPNWHLDRCRDEQIVGNLNFGRDHHHSWRALSVEADEDQQLVTIHLETRGFDLMEFQPFSITISYGSCLTNGCTKCGN